LDLCCGGGGVAFLLEEKGAEVTAIDSSPRLIEMARREAMTRRSRAHFIQADIFRHDWGDGLHDLVLCLGNAVLDFPPELLPLFRGDAFRAVKADGALVLEYQDGVMRNARESQARDTVVQEAPERIERRYRSYDPVRGAYVAEYRNVERNETCEYTGFIYTRPLIQLALEPRFRRESSVRLSERGFLDVFRPREDVSRSG
jgi:SAM-dependent methyltransferase